jgi:multiple sugar transport system permease protein
MPSKTYHKRKDAFWKRVVTYVILVIVAITAFFPIYWAFITSIKVELDTFRPSFIPFLQFRPTLRHWSVELSEARPEYIKHVTNSLLVAGVSTLIALTIGLLAGYSLARFKIKLGPMSNRDLTTFIFSQIIFPQLLLLFPFSSSFALWASLTTNLVLFLLMLRSICHLLLFSLVILLWACRRK